MNNDNTNDGAEPSPASAGSHGEPVGWQATDEFGRPSGFLSWRCGETRWPNGQTVPLYLQPQPTLTDEELEAIAWAINKTAQSYDDAEGGPIKREAMRGLLQRTK